ncbi:uncharacterized protein LY89DRAFT_82978 [Mollisia scopiformis]|uniref:Uncharacterized protein n=1 Tax=Mollisia scopiformis TaxID=149040 RepID=A0A194X9D6_MOLSC|nr:uncharacterized protein LY89DRAFT_82978 [Mollisia scopiformis]KUJ16397.1 hypothetical protein LY89DRAFT_82978 [Mollisia scopiformis]
MSISTAGLPLPFFTITITSCHNHLNNQHLPPESEVRQGISTTCIFYIHFVYHTNPTPQRSNSGGTRHPRPHVPLQLQKSRLVTAKDIECY